MKKIVLSMIIILNTSCVNSKSNEIEKLGKKYPKDQSSISIFKDGYYNIWLRKKILPAKVENIVRNMIGQHYRVIWIGDANLDNINDYVVVVETPGIVKGTKKGIFISGTGEIFWQYNTQDGMWNKKHKIFDFKRLGIKDGEIKSIRLLFDKGMKSFRMNKKDKRYFQNEYGTNINHAGYFVLQLIDQDECVFGYGKGFSKAIQKVWKYAISKENIISKKVFKMYFIVFAPSEHIWYVDAKKYIKEWRILKRQGKAVKIINFQP